MEAREVTTDHEITCRDGLRATFRGLREVSLQRHRFRLEASLHIRESGKGQGGTFEQGGGTEKSRVGKQGKNFCGSMDSRMFKKKGVALLGCDPRSEKIINRKIIEGSRRTKAFHFSGRAIIRRLTHVGTSQRVTQRENQSRKTRK